MSNPPKLSVNINKVALLRNARPLDIPNIEDLAKQCISAGAHGITVHPRPDERHIRRSDVDRVARVLRDYPDIEYNIEGNPFEGLMDIVRAIKPTQCTLVPDTQEQSTSDHGWDPALDGARLGPVIAELKQLDIRVALFMDPDPAQIEQIAKFGPDRIELYTEPYAQAFASPTQSASLAAYRRAAECATALGLGVNAGHDLNLANLPALVAECAILECSIGHALVADALSYGMVATVEKYRTALGW